MGKKNDINFDYNSVIRQIILVKFLKKKAN